MKNNWQTKKLGDICEIINGSTPLRSNKAFWDHGDVAWFTIDDIREQGRIIKYTKQKITKQALGKNSVRLLPPESILLCCTASIGEYAITKIPLTTNQQFNGLVVKDKKILDSVFLFYFASTLKDQLLGLSGKTTIDFIPISRLKGIEITLPLLAEQKRIVKKLDEVFEKVAQVKENAENNLQNSKELFESYLRGVFKKKSNDWEDKRLGDIGKVSMCKRVFKNQTTKTGDIPFYKIGTFGKKSNAFISNEIYNEFRKKFSFPKKGDILISASGTIGRRVKYDGEPAYFQDSNIVWIDNDEKQVLNDYLYHFYGACDWNSTKGATISRLYNGNLKQIEIAFPKSLAEQKDIVKKIDMLSIETKKLEKIYEHRLANLEELKKSVLAKALNGGL